jgi:hypothetical protein
MKSASRLLVLAIFFATSLSLGMAPKALSVKELVDQYYQHKDSGADFSRRNSSYRPPGYCDPVGPSCVDVACDKLGHFGCDDLSEIKEVGVVCRGNYDGSCLEAVCAKLGHFGCDDLSEIRSVARACVGNYDLSCFESVCSRLGAFGCDDVKEVEDVLKTCVGN